MNDRENKPPFSLDGEELASVTFIRDYIQLSFDGSTLSFIVDPVIFKRDIPIRRSETGFCESLLSLIGQKVVRFEVRDQVHIRITFQCGDSVFVSLRNEDRKWGPEAVTFRTRGGILGMF